VVGKDHRIGTEQPQQPAEQPVASHDLVTIDPLTWHQFHAAADCPLGFLCLVSRTRDRPQLPTAEESARLTGG
jgi:hypothetical protein